MRFLTARSLVLATLLPALALFVVAPGCAKQSEGERCGDSLGAGANEDCGDNLTCISHSELLNGADEAHRCCYSDGHVSDPRCERKDNANVSVGGAGGSGAAVAGAGGGGATSVAGTGGNGVGEAGTGA